MTSKKLRLQIKESTAKGILEWSKNQKQKLQCS